MSIAREEAKRLLERLPDSATWEDIMYQLYVRMKVEASLEQVDAGEVIPHEDIEQELLSE